MLPGRAEPVSSARVEGYVTDEFYSYYNFYRNCKHAGSPFPPGWLDWPPWTVQLMSAFDDVIDREKRDNEYKFFARIHGYRVN
jgi:hypothetical protein